MKRSALLVIGLLLGGVSLISAGCQKGKEDDPGEKPITLTWYLRGDAERMSNLRAIKEIEEQVGVKIEYLVPVGDAEDSFQMMLASGKLPDIIQWSYPTYPSKGSVNSVFLDNIALDLTPYIKEYAPNLSAIYQNRPEIYNEILTLDGKLLYFAAINPMLRQEEIARKANSGLIIRADWLESLGLQIPQTMEDWYETLSAFKKGDPNKNGQEDEIPFDGNGISNFVPAFGILEGICVRDGKVIYGPMEQEYREYLECMRLWYLEGLIDKESLMAASYWREENIKGNITGSFSGLDNAWSAYLEALQEKEPNARLAAVPWPRGEDDNARYTGREEMATHLSREITIITNECEYPEKAVELIDFFYGEKGDTLLHWGVEGETYEIVNGKKRLTEEALKVDPESGRCMLVWNYAIPYQGFPKYNGEEVVHQLYTEEWLEAELVWAECDTSLIYPPTIIMSEKELKIVNEHLKEIKPYAANMKVQFITDTEPLNNYDNYVKTLQKLGINEVLEIYQRNYDIYYKRMESIGKSEQAEE